MKETHRLGDSSQVVIINLLLTPHQQQILGPSPAINKLTVKTINPSCQNLNDGSILRIGPFDNVLFLVFHSVSSLSRKNNVSDFFVFFYFLTTEKENKNKNKHMFDYHLLFLVLWMKFYRERGNGEIFNGLLLKIGKEKTTM